nr:MAG TPA: hypothetical protein [Caudoviricetes sp.]
MRGFLDLVTRTGIEPVMKMALTAYVTAKTIFRVLAGLP